jgi:hypothetical protein
LKKLFLVLLAVAALSSSGIIFSPLALAAEDAKDAHVVAYYFHGNFRCFNCYRIEQYSKEAIEQYFKDELDSGKLVFKIINIEEKGNEQFIKDYQLYTKSLIISLVKNGKEVKFDNLVKVWEFLGNKQKFYDYVKDEITQYLKEL